MVEQILGKFKIKIFVVAVVVVGHLNNSYFFQSIKSRCSESLSKFQYCNQSLDKKSAYIPKFELESNLDLMNPDTKPLPIWFNTIILLLFLLLFRLMGYLVLRYSRKPTTC